MKPCECGSYAINPRRHGREVGKLLDLCDVCYWRTIAQEKTQLPQVPEGKLLVDDIPVLVIKNGNIWHTDTSERLNIGRGDRLNLYAIDTRRMLTAAKEE